MKICPCTESYKEMIPIKRNRIFLPFLLLFALVGCSAQIIPSVSAPADSTAASAVAESTVDADSIESEAETSGTATTEEHTLVVYFSATGTTKAIAEKIAGQTGASLYAITPAQPYTSDDLNYNDNNSRANREMNDASVRPELAGDKIDLDSYDAIYLGYPIWWGTAPRIVESFLDSYSCDGKTIYLFCTSGSSGAEKSLKDLQKLYPKINFAAADRFSAKASDTDVSNWLSRLSN